MRTGGSSWNKHRNTIIEGNTRVITEALERKRNAEDKHAQAYEACKQDFDEAKKAEPLKILAEIEELKNFADPEVFEKASPKIVTQVSR